jgi:DNA-binding XRE family transcriptional regulator
MPDFLDEIIELSTEEDPLFPQKVQAALDQRVLMRELADVRLAANISQTKLAAAAGTSQSQIARAESGDVDVRLSTVARMAAVLGKRIQWTIVDTDSSV